MGQETSGIEGVDTAKLEKAYMAIASNKKAQMEDYQAFLKQLPEGYTEHCVDALEKLGICLDIPTGHICYMDNFKPVEVSYSICYMRHGETYGNLEPRCFQGPVNYERNQLTSRGKQHAEAGAKLMDEEIKNGFKIDLVVLSPQDRVQNTAAYFIRNHSTIPVFTMENAAEMAFGEWDNMRLVDIDSSCRIHLIHLDQNAVVKSLNNPHNEAGIHASENFVEVLLRAHELLKEIQNKIATISTKQPNVLIFGHNVIGTAIRTLLGDAILGDDGKSILFNARATKLEYATPIYFHKNRSVQQ